MLIKLIVVGGATAATLVGLKRLNQAVYRWAKNYEATDKPYTYGTGPD